MAVDPAKLVQLTIVDERNQGETFMVFVASTDTIERLKAKIAMQRHFIGYYSSLMTPAGMWLSDNTTVASNGINYGDRLNWRVIIGGPPRNVMWQPFIKSTSPAIGEEEVDLLPVCTATFQRAGPLYASKFINLKELVKLSDEKVRDFQNLWRDYLKDIPITEVFWSDKLSRRRVVLLKLRTEFVNLTDDIPQLMKYLTEVKYDCFRANHSYYGGDLRSWQRYTNELPIKCDVEADEASCSVTLQPRTPLEPLTWYAFTLLHSNHVFDDAIYEDYLIPFRTKAASTALLAQSADSFSSQNDNDDNDDEDDDF